MNKLNYLWNTFKNWFINKETPKRSSGNLTPGERDRLFARRKK